MSLTYLLRVKLELRPTRERHENRLYILFSDESGFEALRFLKVTVIFIFKLPVLGLQACWDLVFRKILDLREVAMRQGLVDGTKRCVREGMLEEPLGYAGDD